MRKFRSFTEKAELPPEAPSFRCACSRVWPFPFSAPAAAGPQHLLPSHDPGADAPGEQIESPHLAGHMSVLLRQERDARLTKCMHPGAFVPLSAPAARSPQSSGVQTSNTNGGYQIPVGDTQLDMCIPHSGFLPVCISEPARSLGSMCTRVCVCVSVSVCVRTHPTSGQETTFHHLHPLPYAWRLILPLRCLLAAKSGLSLGWVLEDAATPGVPGC